MSKSVFLKVSSAFMVGGHIAKTGEIVEVSEGEAKDLLQRGKAILATAADAPEQPAVEVEQTGQETEQQADKAEQDAPEVEQPTAEAEQPATEEQAAKPAGKGKGKGK